MSHTPGPWSVATPTYGANGVLYIVAPQQNENEWPREVAVLYSGGEDEQESNARLIAAAPELLAACNGVAEWFTTLKRQQHEQLVLGQSLESASRNWEKMVAPSLDLTPLLTAIAKAEGTK